MIRGISPLSRNCCRAHFDVLLPIHEQGFLFARARQRLEGRVGLELPGFRVIAPCTQGRFAAARSIRLAAAAKQQS